MKVLWITSVYPSSQKPGEGVFHETQVQALYMQGVDVTVICPLPVNPAPLRLLKKKYRQTRTVPEYEERKGIPVYRPPYTALPGQLKWAQPHCRIAKSVLRTIEKYSLAPNLIHAHFAMPSGGAAAVIAQRLKVPYVLTLHGSDVNIYPHYSKGAFRAFDMAVHAAAKVLAVSDALKAKTKEMTGADCSVLPIGVNLDNFQKNSASTLELREKLGLPTDKKLLTFVGRLVKGKGVAELAEAVRSLDDSYRAVFIGDGPEKQHIRQIAGEKAILTGQVSNLQISEYLAASDLFVLPSYSEGMPTVVIEALALKVPVLCTAVGGVPSLFGKHEHLLIKPRSASSITEAVKGYLEVGTWQEVIAEELYQTVLDDYDAFQNAGKLLDVYKDVVKNN
ncbi:MULTISPECIES: teichuronic acid biosynthesis protein TuaC [Bacillus]|uniref:teichuronic acid biosynthesis protein TuaC n=1 Tax=Bacillus TaxID=1386 RepID=UPI000617E647|nr:MULTISPECIES: glycosyltransferase family 4 protein [Bacillus]ARW00448.1 Putative teichuronic acid biosynthesis glycosyltransferase TuaC [Bacillus subtilis subsp. subtilis]ARW04517.1 Putative teichuronic acid biosynthesis glycosyltransferase TuaC [Bacillus subtilis subsp. subtilis]ASB58927.1 Putative teichuronic acid biosynthesis glycosyltransferase TuaC [Bacillus subtilis subsp. subtilis]KKB90636.1 glycosyl transferase family 1 [Bacillus sp. CMAA 1185]MBC9026660.1 glycosyltransferase family